MTLMACKECGHQVSDKDGSLCPGCGAPSGSEQAQLSGHRAVAISIAVLGVTTFVFAPPPYGPFVGGVIMIFGVIAAIT